MCVANGYIFFFKFTFKERNCVLNSHISSQNATCIEKLLLSAVCFPKIDKRIEE